ncbi:MAG: ASCH domain-containing protein [Caldilineales bacterium]
MQRQIEATDRQIDQLVYELYELMDEERSRSWRQADRQPVSFVQTDRSSDDTQKRGVSLSIRQPYAEQILRGKKRIEYRSRPTKIWGRIYIYAASLAMNGTSVDES